MVLRKLLVKLTDFGIFLGLRRHDALRHDLVLLQYSLHNLLPCSRLLGMFCLLLFLLFFVFLVLRSAIFICALIFVGVLVIDTIVKVLIIELLIGAV